MSDEEENFSQVVLSKVDPEKTLPADIYLKIDRKFIRFRGQGDIIGADKFDSFMAKGVEGIYVKDGEIMNFLDWVTAIQSEEVDAVVREAGPHAGAIAVGTSKVKEKLYKTFVGEEISSEVVKELQQEVDAFISLIKEEPFSLQSISALTKKNATIADHSVNVANFSVYLALVMGHGFQNVLENVYLGAILHDLGKAKNSVVESGLTCKTISSDLLKAHPEHSVHVIRNSKGLADSVYKIILQHHEYWDGSGYPAGLSGNQIYDMAQIVSLANYFDNILYVNRYKTRSDAWDIAVEQINRNKEKFWNPKFFPRVLDALSKAKPS